MPAATQLYSRFVDHEPVVPQLVLAIRRRIIRSDLTPGSRVSEAEFATEFSVSRQPVREAFIVLSNQGLLERRPQRGTYVPKISLQQVREARFVREAIEADVVKLAVRQLDASQVKKLYAQLAQQALCKRDEAEKFMLLDDKFHQTLADDVGQSQAWRVVENLKVQMDRVRLLSLQKFPTAVLLDQHRAIVSAIADKDASLAESKMRLHLNNINSDLEIIARNNPEYFKP